MQIVVRRDLYDVSRTASAPVARDPPRVLTNPPLLAPKKEQWGVGPLMAQAAHAATAVRPLPPPSACDTGDRRVGRCSTRHASDRTRSRIWPIFRTCARCVARISVLPSSDAGRHRLFFRLRCSFSDTLSCTADVRVSDARCHDT